jgi:carbon monoxide dehydrogenase subunit G
MASIYKEFTVNAPPQFAWEAIKDVGAVHVRLAQGFVTDTKLEGGVRTVTFANGLVIQEQIVSTDDQLRRLVYRAIGGKASHHNAFFQVFPAPDGKSTVLWVTDLLPDEMRAPIEQMVESGSDAIQRTMEKSYRAKAD